MSTGQQHAPITVRFRSDLPPLVPSLPDETISDDDYVYVRVKLPLSYFHIDQRKLSALAQKQDPIQKLRDQLETVEFSKPVVVEVKNADDLTPPPPPVKPAKSKIVQYLMIGATAIMLLAAGFITYDKYKTNIQWQWPPVIIGQPTNPPIVEQPDDLNNDIGVKPPKPPAVVAPRTARSVINAQKYFVAYQMNDGTVEKRIGGSPSWRANNPGRIAANEFAKAFKSIGQQNANLAIFPSYQHGQRALSAMLFERDEAGYTKLTVSRAIAKLVGSAQSAAYLKELLALVPGLSSSTVMNTIPADTRVEIVKAIEMLEVFQVGTTEKFANPEEYKKKG